MARIKQPEIKMNFIKKHYFLNKEPNYKDNQGIDYLFKTPFELQRNAIIFILTPDVRVIRLNLEIFNY